MFGDRAESWNRRDRHMADTLDHLLAHLDRHGGRAKVVVWAHNSHVGDARYTEMGQPRGAEHRPAAARTPRRRRRQRRLHDLCGHGHGCRATGAAEAEQRRVRPAPEGSYEAVLHETGLPTFLLCPLGSGADQERPARAALASCDRRDLPAGDRTTEPLVRRRPSRSSTTTSSYASTSARAVRAARAGRVCGRPPSRPRPHPPTRRSPSSRPTRLGSRVSI